MRNGLQPTTRIHDVSLVIARLPLTDYSYTVILTPSHNKSSAWCTDAVFMLPYALDLLTSDGIFFRPISVRFDVFFA